jgi:hypothetical protein
MFVETTTPLLESIINNSSIDLEKDTTNDKMMLF